MHAGGSGVHPRPALQVAPAEDEAAGVARHGKRPAATPRLPYFKGVISMSRIAVVSVVAGSLIALGGAARADAGMDWNNLAAVIGETDGMAHPEPATKWSPKEDAEEIVAVAVFQAVNTIHPLYTPAREALAPPVGEASVVAAVAAAGHAALVSMFPERKAVLDDDFAVMLADLTAG